MYGGFGGQYVPETLMNTLKELENALYAALNDESFMEEYRYYLKEYVGRNFPFITQKDSAKNMVRKFI